MSSSYSEDSSANGSNGNVAGHAENAKNSLFSSAQSAMSAVNNHPTTQNLKDNIANGEVSVVPSRPRLQRANRSRDTVPKSPKLPQTLPRTFEVIQSRT
jgi:hypothetical protein